MKRTNQNRGEKGTSDSKDKIRSSDATRKFDDCRDKIRRKKNSNREEDGRKTRGRKTRERKSMSEGIKQMARGGDSR